MQSALTSSTSRSFEELDRTSTGTARVLSSLRSVRSTSRPVTFGRSRSRRIKAGTSAWTARRASSPSAAVSTVYPRRRRLTSQPRRRNRSSSTRRMVFAVVSMGSPGRRQGEGEGRAPALLGLARNAPSELLHDEAHEVKAEPGALGLDRHDVVRPVELLEHPRLGLWRNADPVVADGPPDALVLAVHPYGDGAAARRVLDGVGDEVEHHLPQELRVGQRRRDLAVPPHRDAMASLLDE